MLLLWKTLLVKKIEYFNFLILNYYYFLIQLTLGGLNEALCLRNECRKQYNLPIIVENSLDILNKMPPATPPPNPIDLVNELQNPGMNGSKKSKKV